MEDRYEIFRQLDIFNTLSDGEIEKLNSISSEVKFKAEERVITEGDSHDFFYVVEKGGLRVTRNHILLSVLTAGSIVGELSLLDGGPASATVITVEDTVLIRIGFSDLQGLMDKEKDMALKVYKSFSKTLSMRLRDANEWLSMCHRDWLSELSRSLKNYPHM